MKLLIENIDPSSLQLIKEDVKNDLGIASRVYRLRGPMLAANLKNRNGRIYQLETLAREVQSYNDSFIKLSRSVGTLDHDSTPNIALDRVSHVLEDLYMEGDVGFGTARIIDTPCGRIAQNLMDAGIQLGMSTRGVGSLSGEMVGDDFNLLSVDIVQQPSCQKAYVESVYEGKEWIAQGDKFVEAAIVSLKKKMDKQYDKFGQSDLALKYMLEFVEQIRLKTV
jgi:hypothetical protein